MAEANDQRMADMERDHRAINHMMNLILDEVRLIRDDGVTAHNIRYAATQAREWSGRYCKPESP